MSRVYKALGEIVYIHDYRTGKDNIKEQLISLLSINGYKITKDILEANSFIHIPINNEFKLSYDLSYLKEVNIFLLKNTPEDIFLTYVKKKTNVLNIYPFNLNKNIGVAENALILNKQIKPNFNNSFDELLYIANQLINKNNK